MFVELIDLLRCPRPHEDSWLVMTATRTERRHVLEGTLGCPVCAAEYPVSGGVADLRDARELPAASAPMVYPDDAALPMTLAAYAALGDPGGAVALGGGLASAAAELESLTSVAALVLNPPDGLDPMTSALRCAGNLPVAPNGLRALVLDEPTSEVLELSGAIRAVRPGGRIVAPAGVAVPAGVRELARDESWWVAERVTPPVTLRRA